MRHHDKKNWGMRRFCLFLLVFRKKVTFFVKILQNKNIYPTLMTKKIKKYLMKKFGNFFGKSSRPNLFKNHVFTNPKQLLENPIPFFEVFEKVFNFYLSFKLIFMRCAHRFHNVEIRRLHPVFTENKSIAIRLQNLRLKAKQLTCTFFRSTSDLCPA